MEIGGYCDCEGFRDGKGDFFLGDHENIWLDERGIEETEEAEEAEETEESEEKLQWL